MDGREPQRHGRRTASSRPTPRPARRPAWSRPTLGTIAGAARIRVIPDLPWSFDFEDGREARRRSGRTRPASSPSATLEGNKVLVKLAENDFAFAKRCRPFFGGPEYSNYTIEADIRAMERRRQMGDIGIVAQRYELVVFGNHQRLDLQPWQPETQRTMKMRVHVEKDTWYTMKLEVQSLDGGKVRARGKVWPKGQPSRRRGRSSASIRSAASREARASTQMRRRAPAAARSSTTTTSRSIKNK